MKLIINRKDHKILLLSNITKDYPSFIQIIKTYDKITDELIKYQSYKLKNFIEHMLPAILQQAILEWKAKEQIPQDLGEDKQNWTACSLCGQPNRYIHYIQNRLTGKVINVGSECVKEYEFVEGNTEQQRRIARRLRRLNLLNEQIPGIKKIIDNWNQNKENFKIWIPEKISNQYDILGERINSLYEEFLTGKSAENSIKVLKDIIRQSSIEIQKFKKYSDSQLNNPFAVTTSIFRWMKRDNNNENIKNVHRHVRYNGLITYKVAHRITEQNFMKMMVGLLNGYLQRTGVIIKQDIVMEKQYQVQINDLEQCDFYISHQELLINFGWILFKETPYLALNQVEMMKCCTLKDEQSVDKLLKYIAQQLMVEDVTLVGYDYDFNELVLFKKTQQEYRLMQLNLFISKFKVLALHQDSELKNELFMKLNSNSKLLNSMREYQHSRDGYNEL